MDLIAGIGDFSANAIEVSHDPLDQRTIDLLANYTKVLTTEQQWAVMDALIAMDNSGALAKCKKMYIPWLAGALGEVFINAVDGSYTVDKTPDATYWGIVSQGLKNINPTTITAAELKIDFTGTGLTSLDMSMLFFNNEEYTIQSDAFSIYSNGGDEYAAYSFLSGILLPKTNFRMGGINLYSLIDSADSQNIGFSKELKGFNLLGNAQFIAYKGATKLPIDYTSAPLEGSVTGMIDLAGLSQLTMQKAHGFIFFGLGLTDAEYASVNTAANLIATALSI